MNLLINYGDEAHIMRLPSGRASSPPRQGSSVQPFNGGGGDYPSNRAQRAGNNYRPPSGFSPGGAGQNPSIAPGGFGAGGFVPGSGGPGGFLGGNTGGAGNFVGGAGPNGLGNALAFGNFGAGGPAGGFGQGGFGFGGPGVAGPPAAPAPTGIGGMLGNLFGGGGAAGGAGFNINQIKGYIDQMGGIEGIMGTVTKVQKFMGTMQQMAPMLKLVAGSLGAKAAATDEEETTSKRRRRRSRGKKLVRKNRPFKAKRRSRR